MTNFSLSDLTLDNIGRWPAVVKYFMVSLVVIILCGLGYWIIIKPNFEQYDSLLLQEVTLKSDFELKQQQAANLQAYKNQLQIMNERFGNMLKQLPTQNEMAGLLEDISKTGISSGLTFQLFAPEPEVVHDFYIEVPISIEVVGNYHQLARFLSRIAEMSRIVTLHDFEINVVLDDKQKAAAATATTVGTGDLLEMKITAKIYRYRTQ